MLRPLKPSLGDNGHFCVCYKPPKSYDAFIKWRSSPKEFDQVQSDWEQRQQDQVTDANVGALEDEVRIYQEDFAASTLRIQQSGTYRLMENILFDSNAGDLNASNAGEKQWWPLASQADKYPGAESTRDAYLMGFFAGITSEVKRTSTASFRTQRLAYHPQALRQSASTGATGQADQLPAQHVEHGRLRVYGTHGHSLRVQHHREGVDQERRALRHAQSEIQLHSLYPTWRSACTAGASERRTTKRL